MLEMTFEQALKNALFADLEKEYGHFMNSDFELPPHSKKYLWFEKKILRDPMGYVHQRKRPIWQTVLRKAALIIIAITVFIGLIMSIPPVRAFVFSVVEELVGYDKHTTDEIRPEESIYNYNIGYLPVGYVESYDNNTGIKIYSKGEVVITFMYDYVYSSSGVLFDNEYRYTRSIQVGDFSGELYTSIANRQKSMLLWYDTDEKVCFILTSKIDVDELIKIAESVYLVE